VLQTTFWVKLFLIIVNLEAVEIKMQYYYNIVSGLIVMAISIQASLTISRYFGSYWYGVIILTVVSLVVIIAYRKDIIGKASEYVVMSLAFAFVIVGGGLVYSALRGVKPV
jgi:hypothetical protein